MRPHLFSSSCSSSVLEIALKFLNQHHLQISKPPLSPVFGNISKQTMRLRKMRLSHHFEIHLLPDLYLRSLHRTVSEVGRLYTIPISILFSLLYSCTGILNYMYVLIFFWLDQRELGKI